MPSQQVSMDDDLRALIAQECSRASRRVWMTATVCLGGPLVFGVTQWFNPMNDSPGQRFGVVFLTLFLMLIFGMIPYGLRERLVQLQADLDAEHVLVLTGHVEEKRWSKHTGRQVKIAGEWLEPSVSDYASLAVGMVVEVHYMPTAKRIVRIQQPRRGS